MGVARVGRAGVRHLRGTPMTPIERAAAALTGLEVPLHDGNPHYARAVFASIDPEQLARLLIKHRRNRAINFGAEYACICGEVLRSNSHHAQAEHQAQSVINHLLGETRD